MTITAYLAGPDVFLPEAREHARRKVAVCARYGLVGRAPLDEDTLSGVSAEAAWRAIFGENLATMAASDIIIANLTRFRGASADAGTLIEVGWFLGRGRPVFGYTNIAQLFKGRTHRQIAAVPNSPADLTIEDFGLPDNLMVAGAALEGGGLRIVEPPDGRDRPLDALDLFERCVALAAARL